MTAPRRVLRYVVPIDGQVHEIADGRVLMAAPQRDAVWPARELEVWVEAEILTRVRTDPPLPLEPAATSDVQVVGTGEPLPADAEHLASCIDDRLVWHLYRRRP